MATDGRLDVGDVHANAVVRICADDDRAVLCVEREVGDVDIARGLEDASRLPVKLPVVAQHHADPLEVRNQLLRAVVAVSATNYSKFQFALYVNSLLFNSHCTSVRDLIFFMDFCRPKIIRTRHFEKCLVRIDLFYNAFIIAKGILTKIWRGGRQITPSSGEKPQNRPHV